MTIRREVKILELNSLIKVVSLSRKVEKKLYISRHPTHANMGKFIPPTVALHSVVLTPTQIMAQKQSSTTNNIPIRRLSPTEMEKHRRRELCFNCDEKFSRRYQC